MTTHRRDITHRIENFLQQRNAGKMDAILRQVADAGMTGQDDMTGIRSNVSDDALHQGGFAGAIVTGESDALPALHHEGERIEQNPCAVCYAELLDGKLHNPSAPALENAGAIYLYDLRNSRTLRRIKCVCPGHPERRSSG